LWEWYDNTPSLRAAILASSAPPPGMKRPRAFCAGQDLKEWDDAKAKGVILHHPPGGFGGLSKRRGKKPVICAVDGLCLGGGLEMVKSFLDEAFAISGS